MDIKLKKSIAVSESGFVFNAGTGDSYSVNPIGAEMINLLKEHKSFDEIKSVIIEKYDVDNATFEKDYYDFVNMLMKLQLIEKDDA